VSALADARVARAAADEWAAERGLPPSGGYSGQWYQDGYLNGWWPEGWPKWWAAYGITPGSILGGLVVAHQYTSTPIDSNVMLESEIVSQSGGGDVPDPNVDYGWQQKKDLVVQTAGELLAVSDQLLAEANRRGGPRAKEIRRLANPEVRARAEKILA
jgi:hypothetical protein